MRDFLIDTMIWEYWFNPMQYSREHASIERRVQGLHSLARLGISVITWGEIAVGLKRVSSAENSVQTQHLDFIKAKRPWIIDINKHVSEKYGELRGMWGMLGKGRKKQGKLVDRRIWLELGSFENDLWIASSAIVYNLTLVTHDRKLASIRRVAGSELHVEDWAT